MGFKSSLHNLHAPFRMAALQDAVFHFQMEDLIFDVL